MMPVGSGTISSVSAAFAAPERPAMTQLFVLGCPVGGVVGWVVLVVALFLSAATVSTAGAEEVEQLHKGEDRGAQVQTGRAAQVRQELRLLQAWGRGPIVRKAASFKH